MGSQTKLDLKGAQIDALQVGDHNVQHNNRIDPELVAERRANLKLVAAVLGEMDKDAELVQELETLANAPAETVSDSTPQAPLPGLLERAHRAFQATERGVALYARLPATLRSWIESMIGLS